MRSHQSTWLLNSVLFASLATVAGCTRHVYASKEMTWECAPEHYMPEYPEAQTVRFKFVENPSYEDEISGKGLCGQLMTSGKKTVMVEYDDTWGNSYRGLIGFRQVSVDSKPIVNAGGWGSTGERVDEYPRHRADYRLDLGAGNR